MVLAIGKFQVSKYAAPGGAAAGGVGLDFGLGTVGGNQFGGGGMGQLIPSNVFPHLIGPGGEILPGGGGSPLPGGVPVEMPAYADHPGPFWDASSLGYGGGYGGRPAKTFGSRILNVNLPKMISAGQPFAIITTYIHQGDNFTTYKVKVNIPILQVMETSQEKRVANGGQDNVVVNLTAPAPLPNAVITGTVELVQTEGNEVTVDSEIITIPSDIVPNPPPPPPVTPPLPPDPSPPPTAPPPPPVPIPPVLQLIAVTITRGEEAGLATIIVEASNLDPSEPCTLFIYLSTKPPAAGSGGWGNNGNDNWNNRPYHEKMISMQTPAGSIAATNIAYAYPASISVGGITGAGNGLKLTTPNKASSMLPGNKAFGLSHKGMHSNIKNNVMNAVQSKGGPPNVAQIAAQAAEMGAKMGPAGAAAEATKAVLFSVKASPTAIANAGSVVAKAVASAGGGANASASAGQAAAQAVASAGGSQAVASVAGAAAAAAAGSVTAIAVGEPYPGMPLPIKPIFKRQRVSLTATEAGTIRHVVRIQSVPVGAKLHGFVIVYGHRSKKHSGRKPFSL